MGHSSYSSIGEETPLLPSTPTEEICNDNVRIKRGLEENRSTTFSGIGYISRRILPFCGLNVAFSSILLYYWKRNDMSLPQEFCLGMQGHEYITCAMAFAVVSRVFVSLKRFHDFHGCFFEMCGTTRTCKIHCQIFLGGFFWDNNLGMHVFTNSSRSTIACI